MKKPTLDYAPPLAPRISGMAVAAFLYSVATSPPVLWPLAWRAAGRKDWRLILLALLLLPLSAWAAGLLARQDVLRLQSPGRPVRGRLLARAACAIGVLAFLTHVVGTLLFALFVWSHY